VAAATRDLTSALEREWYHTLELAPGVITPGWFDTREALARLPFPASLEGKRCLDVATFDGFWAFEMERRGATETIAIDLLDVRQADWPVNSSPEVMETIGRRKEAGEGFDIARSALGSAVERIEMNVYDLDPGVVGEFDFVYVGSLLIHLRDPVRALERVRSVCRGSLLVVDNVDLGLTLRHPRRPVAALDGVGRPWWWNLNLAGLVRIVEVAGFRVTAPPSRLWMPPGRGQRRPRPSRQLVRSLLRSEDARERLLGTLKGDLHGAILAEPVHHHA
jgi:tRNA (mo5U34)-methyltransferase